MTHAKDEESEGRGEESSRNPSVPEVERFFVTDRSVGWLVGSLTLTATQVSAGTLVGAVGLHYLFGVSFAAAWPGIWLGWFVSMYYVAPQMRRFGGVTVPEYLAARFDGDGAGGKRVLALTSTLVGLVYLVFTAAQYVAGGVVVETILGVPRLYGMAGIMAVTLVYTALGGMRASILTDVLLALLMVLGVAVAAFVGVRSVGGPTALFEGVRSVDASLLGFAMPLDELLGFALAFGIAMTVAPYQISRVYAMTDEATVQTAIKGTVVVQFVIAVCITVLGLVAVVSFPELADPDAAVAELIVSLFGPVAGWLLLAAVVAAVVSTLDSVLLVSASSVAYDLYLGVLRGEAAEDRTPDEARLSRQRPKVSLSAEDGKKALLVARSATVVVAVVPFVLALRSGLLGELVQVIVALFASLVAGTLFAPVLLGIHWEGATTRGAVVGVVTGFVVVVAWHFLWTVYDVLPGFLGHVPTTAAGVLCSGIAVVVVSLLENRT